VHCSSTDSDGDESSGSEDFEFEIDESADESADDDTETKDEILGGNLSRNGNSVAEGFVSGFVVCVCV
jgi:hypothetical protein